MSFPAAIARNVRRLLRFDGREARQSFWFYVLFIVGLGFVAAFAIMAPRMASSFNRMQQFAIEQPDQATVTSGPTSYSIQIQGNHPEWMPDMIPVLGAWSAIAVTIVAALAAAVVRRLHDRGRSGWWGVAPLPFLGFGFVAFAHLFNSFGRAAPPDLSWFGAVFINNLLYLASLGGLIVLLAGAGDPGQNRFGSPPSA